ncbi:serine/threonine protein kinase [Tritrichomonas foetus]|uniref:Serine/threonine protein kinase n=1 Tax=Tritrichomonas foetus TaxID=1144522 RepID=A0A1J4KSY5_9EUKA|nr:serine/threonine protein kinase [Tritrichomonas foetus]|eukprot:OHT12900.1 serine/threonine protein kinase [Tritrichomonas foetus]
MKEPLDTYVFKEELGHGRFGTASRVFSPRYNCDFCMKVIDKGKNKNDKFTRQMFIQETEVLRKVGHPNVIRLYDYFETPNSYNIVMEYCPKMTLNDVLEEKKVLSLNTIRIYFRQILDATAYFHSLNITHRDIKPSNIALDSLDRPKYIDWGLSLYSPSDALVTSFCGTFPYAAPECMKKCAYDPKKSDMYSIGICLYILAFGKHPFNPESHSIAIAEAFRGEYSIPPTDETFAALVRNLIQLDPSKRLSARAALEHPFFTKFGSNASGSSSCTNVKSGFSSASSNYSVGSFSTRDIVLPSTKPACDGLTRTNSNGTHQRQIVPGYDLMFKKAQQQLNKVEPARKMRSQPNSPNAQLHLQ